MLSLAQLGPADIGALLGKGWPFAAGLVLYALIRSTLAILALWREREERHEKEICRLNEARIAEAQRYGESLLAAHERSIRLVERIEEANRDGGA